MGSASKRYRDEEWLRGQYVDGAKTIDDIADEVGVDRSTIFRWVENHGIEHRQKKGAVGSRQPATYHDDGRGYRYWTCGVNNEKVPVHKLLAVAAFGFDNVVGKEVHHIDGRKWHNAPYNIELLSPGEHIKRHWEEGTYDDPTGYLPNPKELSEIAKGRTRDGLGRFE